MLTQNLNNSQETEACAAELACQLMPPCVIYLHGELGAGKTTFVRGFLRALGHTGNVKSPTYTLLETYPFASMNCHHLDLYRLTDPYELENLGLRDLLDEQSILLIEWPEMAQDLLPKANIDIALHYTPSGRQIVIQRLGS